MLPAFSGCVVVNGAFGSPVCLAGLVGVGLQPRAVFLLAGSADCFPRCAAGGVTVGEALRGIAHGLQLGALLEAVEASPWGCDGPGHACDARVQVFCCRWGVRRQEVLGVVDEPARGCGMAWWGAPIEGDPNSIMVRWWRHSWTPPLTGLTPLTKR